MCLWPNFKRLSQNLPGGSDENYEKPQDSQSLGQDMIPEPSKHKAGESTNQTQRSAK
jgi:hypothetical protein